MRTPIVLSATAEIAAVISSQSPLPRIGLVILAAGASTRMGTPKQLLRLDGISLLQRAARVALASCCAPVTLVLGAHAESLRPEVQGLPLQIVENPDWPQGMGSSLHAGLQALLAQEPDLEAALFILCDQPGLTPGHLDRMAQQYAATRPALVASEYDGKPGVPALFDRALFPELLALQGAEGAKSVILAHRAQGVTLPFEAGAIDIDTPADYARVVNTDLNPSPLRNGEGG